MSSTRLAAILAAFVTAPCWAMPGDVWLVDSLGGGDFLQIAEAVDAAQDGDTVLVRPWMASQYGAYDAFTIQAKGLRVVAEAFGIVKVEAVRVVGTSDSQQVVLAGFAFRLDDGFPQGYSRPLHILDCDGPVRVSRCHWDGAVSETKVGAATIEDSQDVVLDRCLTEASGMAAGIAILNSRAALYECSSRGSYGNQWWPKEGAPGLLVSGSQVHASHAWTQGGVGPDTCFDFTEDGRGGPGTFVAGASTLRIWDTTLEGGQGGDGGYDIFSCHPGAGPDGFPFKVEAGSKLIKEASVLPRFTVEPTLRRGAEVVIQAYGTPGESLVLRRAHGTVYYPQPPGRGIIHVVQAPGDAGLALGQLDPSGRLTASFRLHDLVADLPAGSVRSVDLVSTLYLQVESPDAPGGSRLGNVVPFTHYTPSLLPPLFGYVIHVDSDAGPGGDGRTWEGAYDDLELALEEAQWITSVYPMGLVEIWVAENVYVPKSGGAGYYRLTGVECYGGFKGDETSREDRDWSMNETVLSADVLGDDGAGFANREDNLGLVLTLEPAASNILPRWPFLGPTSILDGFTIEGAESRAMRAEHAVVRRCWIRDNRSSSFTSALEGIGAAVVECRFTNNSATNGSGALLLMPRLGDSSASPLAESSTLTLLSSVFFGNQGQRGAVSVFDDGGDGGDGGDSEVSNNLFVGNSGSVAGALNVVVGPNGFARIVQNTVYANQASDPDYAAGVQVLLYGKGGLANAYIANSILWENATDGILSEDAQVQVAMAWMGGTLSVDYSCVFGFESLPGVGSHGFDPLFVDPVGPDLIPGTGDEDMNLGAGSPAVDAGSNWRLSRDTFDLDGDGDVQELLPFDLEFKRRRVDDEVPDVGEGQAPIVDMGALERAKLAQ
jgi:hypothetical protein